MGSQKINIAIFASGGGSNAQKIMEYFVQHAQIQVILLISNKHGAGAIEVAKNHGVESLLIDKHQFFEGDGYLPELQKRKVDWIVLAGFLWKVPLTLIDAFPHRIINIHPALLPKYGGKGMYGQYVHEAVIARKEKESGITIHFVDEMYDHGNIIFQASCPVSENDTGQSLAKKIHELEHRWFATILERTILK